MPKNTFLKLLKKVFLFLGIFFIYNFVFAVEVKDLEYTNHVNDFANVLTAYEEMLLNNKLQTLREKTGTEVAIVMVPDMSGDYIEHYAVKLFEKWQMGDKSKDTGLLVLIAVEERKIRFEVGYGLEPVITDGVSKEIIDTYISPNFKNQKFFQGLDSAMDKVSTLLNGGGEYDSSADQTKRTDNLLKGKFWNFFGNFFFVIIFFGYALISWIIAVLARTKSWWLGGVLGGGAGILVIVVFGTAIIFLEIFLGLIVFGFILDFFVSKNYKEHKNNFDIIDPPSWWAGGTWGPGSQPWVDTFDTFGGGSSGGGGWSGDW